MHDPASGSGRPIFHFLASRGWMNDPCAPCYDPATGTFHLMYQWNSYSHKWNNISWGAATSKDMITWTHRGDEPVLQPDQPYDQKGIFTGCMYPSAPDGSAGLSIFYTSVASFPVHWTGPHGRGSEGLSMVTSADGGKTWSKSPQNPIIKEEPGHLTVTGFRDPQITTWPAMAASLSLPAHTRFGVLSGGIQGGFGGDAQPDGPRLFLYTIDDHDLAKWTYAGLLGSLPRDVSCKPWGADWGSNWECGAVCPLIEGDEERSVVIVGVEGGGPRQFVDDHNNGPGNEKQCRRDPGRYLNWYFADLSVAEQGTVQGFVPDMRMGAAGCVDWGDLYALSTFVMPDGRRAAWGWLPEQDVPEAELERRGWTGCLGVPRELGLQVLDGVRRALVTPLKEIGSVDVQETDAGTRVTTLGVKPLEELKQLRGTEAAIVDGRCEAPASYDLELRVRVTPATERVSLTIRGSDDLIRGTSIIFSPQREELVVLRDMSTSNPEVNTAPEVAPLTLFETASGWEELHLRVLVDRDVIEVFANGRCAIATRVYTPPEARGVSVGLRGEGEVRSLHVWQMGSIGLE